MNSFLTDSDLRAIFCDSLKTGNSCKKWPANISKKDQSNKLHEMPRMEGLRLLPQRITHDGRITGQETKSIYSHGLLIILLVLTSPTNFVDHKLEKFRKNENFTFA